MMTTFWILFWLGITGYFMGVFIKLMIQIMDATTAFDPKPMCLADVFLWPIPVMRWMKQNVRWK